LATTSRAARHQEIHMHHGKKNERKRSSSIQTATASTSSTQAHAGLAFHFIHFIRSPACLSVCCPHCKFQPTSNHCLCLSVGDSLGPRAAATTFVMGKNVQKKKTLLVLESMSIQRRLVR
jgi:hypothetical protein